MRNPIAAVVIDEALRDERRHPPVQRDGRIRSRLRGRLAGAVRDVRPPSLRSDTCPSSTCGVTWCVIDEVKSGDWTIGGQPLTTEAVHALAAGQPA
jgi:hypothetical protein